MISRNWRKNWNLLMNKFSKFIVSKLQKRKILNISMMTESEMILKYEEMAKEIADEHDLKSVYFARIFGKRRHYLAGYGKKNLYIFDSLKVSNDIEMFYAGKLDQKQKDEIREELNIC